MLTSPRRHRTNRVYQLQCSEFDHIFFVDILFISFKINFQLTWLSGYTFHYHYYRQTRFNMMNSLLLQHCFGYRFYELIDMDAKYVRSHTIVNIRMFK